MRKPSLLEDSVDQGFSIDWIQSPESSFSRLVSRSGNLDETLVQREVVPNRVLKENQQINHLHPEFLKEYHRSPVNFRQK